MKYIELSQGQRTAVDDEDYEWLNQWKWYALWQKKTQSFYVGRIGRTTDGRKRLIRMNRVILDCPDGMIADHRDHDTLNNQRHNLRVCTHNQNAQNRKRHGTYKSPYKGVNWSTQNKKWQIRIRTGGKSVFLGYRDDPVEAAIVYDNKARELFGEFAFTNF